MTTRASTPAYSAPPGRERFGKYEIIRRLAVGGMAEIYLARAVGIEGFEKLVVLKRILPQYADNDEFITMFLDEARLAATLHHSNVVQVYDIGAVDQQYFLTMEFLDGVDGRQLMKMLQQRGGALPLEHAISIVMGMCSGLHYAHNHIVDGQPLNLVHRDVSPQNVFVTYDGGVKLLDFGIARASSRLTETRGNTLKGKIAYMSPEQCSGLPLDRRSDVFSAAIILWELTTGRRLFTGDSDFEVMRKLREEDPPRPSAVSFAYPLALEKIVLKGLKRNREERYASAEDLLLDLDHFAREARLPVSPVRLSRFMRETFADEIVAKQRMMRGETPPAAVLASAGTDVIRTETSVPGPPPPVLTSDVSVPQLAPRRSRGWMAVAVGIVVGSLATWMAARHESPPREVDVVPAVSAPATQPVVRPSPPPPVVEKAPPVVEKAPPVVEKAAAPVEKAAPPVEKATPPVEKPAAPVEKPAKSAAPVEKAEEAAPVVEKPAPVEKVAAPKRIKRVVKKPPTKKPPPGWDPESLLPP